MSTSMLLADDAQRLREALEKFKGGKAEFSSGHVRFPETEDWPGIDLNCGLAANKIVRNPLARYIAAACNAAPALLREIDRLRAENEREKASRQQAQRELEQAQEDRNKARMRGEIDARRTLQHFIDRAVQTEREACAALCDTMEGEAIAKWETYADPNDQGRYGAAAELAAAIRARGTINACNQTGDDMTKETL